MTENLKYKHNNNLAGPIADRFNAEKRRERLTMLQGLISAVYTPFNKNGSIHLEVIPDYVEYLLTNKMKGLYICGTTGEGVNMTISEREKVAEAFIDAANGRVPTVVQVGANALPDSCLLAAHAESAGASAISANAPSYFRITKTETLVDWLTEIAAAAPKTPFYYYHIPSFTGVDIDMTLFMELMEKKCPQFRGIKYSDIKGFVFLEALEYHDRKYEVLWGCDEMLMAGYALGAAGGVGSTYGMIPDVYNALLEALAENDLDRARRFQLKSWKFVKALLKYSPVHPSGKIVMRLRGIELGPCRLPFTPLDETAAAQLAEDLKNLGC